MAPFRAGRSTRSGRPGGQAEQDIVDGLPIRQWRQQETAVGVPQEETPGNNDIPVEGVGRWMLLPMPKGSESYTPWCQQLLRAARAGRIPVAAKRFRGLDKDDEDGTANGVTNGKDNGGGKKIAKKEEPKGFSIRKWAQLPRNQEEPEIEYLAKRRKGLPSAIVTALANEISSGPMRKTKVRRIDAEGNVSIWDVLVPEGQTVDGEVESDAVLQVENAPVETPLPGTVVEGIGVANSEGVLVATENTVAPIRRRGPPPRRKKKGIGRGRKLPKMTESAGLGVSASAEAHAASTRRRMLAMNGDGEDSGGSFANNTPAETNTGEEDEAEDEGEEEEGEDEDMEEGEIEEDDEDGITRESDIATPALTKTVLGSDEPTRASEMEGVEHNVKSITPKPSTPKPQATVHFDMDREKSSSPEEPLAAGPAVLADAPAATTEHDTPEDISMADADAEAVKPEPIVPETLPMPMTANVEQPDAMHEAESGADPGADPGTDPGAEPVPEPEPEPEPEAEAKIASTGELWGDLEEKLEKEPEPEPEPLPQSPIISSDSATNAVVEEHPAREIAPGEGSEEILPKSEEAKEDNTMPVAAEASSSTPIPASMSADTFTDPPNEGS